MAGSDELRRVQLDYLRMGTVAIAQMLRDLAAVGDDIIQQADANAPASKIHGSLSSRASVSKNGITVSMKISGAASQGAGPAFESISGKPTFKHPLFGNRNSWHTQAAQPFLVPARESHLAIAERRMTEVIEKAARASGWS